MPRARYGGDESAKRASSPPVRSEVGSWGGEAARDGDLGEGEGDGVGRGVVGAAESRRRLANERGVAGGSLEVERGRQNAGRGGSKPGQQRVVGPAGPERRGAAVRR